MSIMDIINPWGALRRARELNQWYTGMLKAQSDITCALMDLASVLEQKLQQAHFRNPKTGRLGKRGETFE